MAKRAKKTETTENITVLNMEAPAPDVEAAPADEAPALDMEPVPADEAQAVPADEPGEALPTDEAAPADEAPPTEQERVISELDEVLESDAPPESAADRLIERRYEESTLGELVDRFKAGTIGIPSAQRIFMWPDATQKLLLRSFNKNYGISDFCIGEHNGQHYLLDGLQRTSTSDLFLALDSDIDEAQKTLIRGHKIMLDVHCGLTKAEMKELFFLRNNGLKLPAIVKWRANMNDGLEDLMLDIASTRGFKGLFTATGAKNSHAWELVATCAMLAAAGQEISSTKAELIVDRVNEHESDILDHADEARALIERLVRIFRKDSKEWRKKVCVAPMMSTIVYLMQQNPDPAEESLDPDAYKEAVSRNDDNIRRVTHQILMYTKPGWYGTAATADKEVREKRLKGMATMLKEIVAGKVIQQQFELYKRKSDKKTFADSESRYRIQFSSALDKEKKALYIADLMGDEKARNAAIEAVFNRIAGFTPILDKKKNDAPKPPVEETPAIEDAAVDMDKLGAEPAHVADTEAVEEAPTEPTDAAAEALPEPPAEATVEVTAEDTANAEPITKTAGDSAAADKPSANE